MATQGLSPNVGLALSGISQMGEGIGQGATAYAQRLEQERQQNRPIGANPQAFFKHLVMDKGLNPSQAAIIAKILLQQQQGGMGAAQGPQLGATQSQPQQGIFPGMQAAQPQPTPAPMPQGAPGAFAGAKPTLPPAEGMMGGMGGIGGAPQEPSFQPPRTAQELADMQSMLAFRNPLPSDTPEDRMARAMVRAGVDREQMGQKDAQFQATMAYKYQALTQQAALWKQRLGTMVNISNKRQASAEDMRLLGELMDYLTREESMLAADAQATQRMPWEPANPVLTQDIARRQAILQNLRTDAESLMQRVQGRAAPGTPPVRLGNPGAGNSKAPAKGVTADDVLNALSGGK